MIRIEAFGLVGIFLGRTGSPRRRSLPTAHALERGPDPDDDLVDNLDDEALDDLIVSYNALPDCFFERQLKKPVSIISLAVY
jgi:hypothetical protein